MAPPPPPASAPEADALPTATPLPSLLGAHRSVAVPTATFWRKLAAYSGPGYLVAVGYMDPGNWATGLAGGSAFGYRLLSVVVVANLMAMFLQRLAAKLGIVTGLDLAQACRMRYGVATRIFLWLLCETAIVACDLAELIGAAIALKLLFDIPLVVGVGLTGSRSAARARPAATWLPPARGDHRFAHGGDQPLLRCGVDPGAAQLAGHCPGIVPRTEIVSDPLMLYLAVGILGATIMPHNLYLHSSIVQTRRFERSKRGIREAIRFSTIDVVMALTLAIFVNASILILAAATFHQHGLTEVVGIEQAYQLLTPALGAGVAGTVFAIALLASGQNSSITGTLAGQIVMEGFTSLRWPPWARRLLARLLAMVPAMFAVRAYGEEGATRLLIFSQVILSLQLPFAVYPLVRMTGSTALMGKFANKPITAIIAWTLTAVLIGLNAVLVADMLWPRA